MPYEHKPNTGSLWEIPKDKRDPKFPNCVMRGDGIFNNQPVYLNLYLATRKDGSVVLGKDGGRLYNLTLKPKIERGSPAESHHAAPTTPKPPTPTLTQDNDDVPF